MANPSDYKKIYHETNTIEKMPSPYKFYEGKMVDNMVGKTSFYNVGNEIEKQAVKVYKALQIHQLLDEDTSTPEVELQGMGLEESEELGLEESQALGLEDTLSGSSQVDPALRQAAAPVSQTLEEEPEVVEEELKGAEEEEEEEEESASASASDSDTSTGSASASEESDASQSSEEATATPGAADSESDESAESQESDSAEEEVVEAEVVTPDIIIAK